MTVYAVSANCTGGAKVAMRIVAGVAGYSTKGVKLQTLYHWPFTECKYLPVVILAGMRPFRVAAKADQPMISK